MTDIPGTGKNDPNEIKTTNNLLVTPLSVVNVSELNKIKNPDETNLNWYDKFHFWVSIGILLSLIFIGISLKYKRFIIFIPLGPLAAIASWYVKRLVRRYEPKPKKYPEIK